jgi:hypothetical protein
MNDLMSGLTDVNGDQGHVIAAAMREVAEVDGMHPAEAQLINQFVGGLPPLEGNVDISLLDTEELRLTYVKSMVLVAYADGVLTDLERDLVAKKSAEVGVNAEQLSSLYIQVARGLLGPFAGIQLYRDQAVEIGRSLGLDDDAIAEVLGPTA